jgi:hypothetical protein
MGIVGSQVKIERIFNMVRSIIGLRCGFGIENLNKLVLIMNNWLDDPKFGFRNRLRYIEEYCFDTKNKMGLKNESLIANFNLFEED